MTVEDLTKFYQNRRLLDQMQRTTGKEKQTTKQAKSDFIQVLKNQASKSGAIDKKSPLFHACQEFEAIFIKQMLDSMRKTIAKSGLIDGGMAEDVFEDMLYDEYSKNMAKSARFGLSETLYKQLSYKDPLKTNLDIIH